MCSLCFLSGDILVICEGVVESSGSGLWLAEIISLHDSKEQESVIS